MFADTTDATIRASQLFFAHYGFVKVVAFRSAPLKHLTEDITHEVYLEFMKKADRWDLSTDIKPLLAKMTRNIALKLWHEHVRNMPDTLRKIAFFVQNATENESEEPQNMEEELAALEICLGRIQEKGRQLIESHYFNGISLKDIAKSMQLKPNTVCQTLCRLRETLRSCIAKTLVNSQ